MGRNARGNIYATSNCFHVLVQGIAKNYIFDEDLYKGYYLKLMSEKSKECGISLLSFCVMGNHAHILVYAEEKKNISKFFQEVNSKYASFYNREKKRVGYVFRDRFRAEAIIDEENLLNCISYIHYNPLKARMVESPEEYKYSSANNYEIRKGIVNFAALEKLFSYVPKSKETTIEFIDDEYEGKVEPNDAIEYVKKKLRIRDIRKLHKNEDLLVQFVTEVQGMTKISLRELATIIGINRESLRKVMKKFASLPPSP